MTGPFARILLRYGAAALVTWGVLSPSTGSAMASDPDMVAVIGFCLGVLVEAWYWAAKRYGGAT